MRTNCVWGFFDSSRQWDKTPRSPCTGAAGVRIDWISMSRTTLAWRSNSILYLVTLAHR